MNQIYPVQHNTVAVKPLKPGRARCVHVHPGSPELKSSDMGTQKPEPMFMGKVLLQHFEQLTWLGFSQGCTIRRYNMFQDGVITIDVCQTVTNPRLLLVICQSPMLLLTNLTLCGPMNAMSKPRV